MPCATGLSGQNPMGDFLLELVASDRLRVSRCLSVCDLEQRLHSTDYVARETEPTEHRNSTNVGKKRFRDLVSRPRICRTPPVG